MPLLRNGHRPSSPQRGIALLLVLLLTVLLAVIVSEFSLTSETQVDVVKNLEADLHYTFALRSALAVAKLILIQDLQQRQTVDSLLEPWAHTMNQPIRLDASTSFILHFEDEESKFPLNSLLTPQGQINDPMKKALIRLLDLLGDQGETLTNQILAFMKPGSAMTNSNTPSSPSPIRYFRMPEELLRVNGIDEKTLLGDPQNHKPGLLPFLSCYTQGIININTVKPEVLYSLSDAMTLPAAQNVANFRQANQGKEGFEFQKPEDLLSVEGFTQPMLEQLKPYLTIKSDYFTITVTVFLNQIQRTAQFLLRRRLEQNHVRFKVLYLSNPFRLIELPKGP